MSYNVPTVDEDELTFGPGVLYLGAVGTTPTTEVGAVDSAMSLKIRREMMDLHQGSPKTLIKRVCVKEEVDMEFTGLQINLENLQKAVGAGEYAAGPPEVLEGGGDMNFTDYSLKFVHQTAAGGTVEVDLWTVNGSGEASFDFGDEWFKFPQKFSAQQSTTNWAGATLAAKKKLYKIIKTDPPV